MDQSQTERTPDHALSLGRWEFHEPSTLAEFD